MSAGTYLKVGGALLVILVAWLEWTGYQERLRLEGEVNVFREVILPATRDSLEAAEAALSVADSVRVSAVAEAVEDARAAREAARIAENAARVARQRTDEVADSVVALYGDTVSAAVEAVRAQTRAEVAALESANMNLREAERRAWAAHAAEVEGHEATRRALGAARATILVQRDLIERIEAVNARKGHSIVVDLGIAALSFGTGFVGGTVFAN